MTRNTCLALALVALLAPVARADLPLSATDTEDAYATASQQLQQANAAVVRARQQAVGAYRVTPAYVGAVDGVDKSFDAFAEKRNALLMGVEQHDPRFATWKKAAADTDTEIAKAGQGVQPAATPEQFDNLLKERDGFAKQLSAAEHDAIERDPDAKRLHQQWVDACGKLRELQDKQSAAVEGADGVKAALATVATARVTADKARAALPAPATADPAEPTVDEFARRYPRYSIGSNEAWLATTPAAGK